MTKFRVSSGSPLQPVPGITIGPIEYTELEQHPSALNDVLGTCKATIGFTVTANALDGEKVGRVRACLIRQGSAVTVSEVPGAGPGVWRVSTQLEINHLTLRDGQHQDWPKHTHQARRIEEAARAIARDCAPPQH